ncbi:MAG: efflux RND transporter periplasmic adaptor subunit, partial [bacterium]
MNDTEKQKSLALRFRAPLIAGFCVIAVVALASLVFRGPTTGAIPPDSPIYEVKQGPLTISVSEAGTISAKDQVVIKSEVEGQNTIIYLMPEGKEVKKGDLLVELDASRLQSDMLDQQIRVQNADASFINAREGLAVTKNQADADVAKAQLEYQFAQDDLKKYNEGEYPNEIKSAVSKITLAKEQLEQASETLDWSKKLNEEKYISQTELEKDRLSFSRSTLDHELAEANLQLLQEYTHERKLAELKSNVDQTSMTLERTWRKASADVVQAEANLRAKESELEQQKNRNTKLQQQLEKTKIYASIDGMVIYATSSGRGGDFRGGNSEPLAEGASVRERQELIYLPTVAAVTAEVKVHETNIKKVHTGLPVRVTVDALPGRTFQGLVTKIAPLPDAQSVFLNPDLKVYNTQIDLSGETEDIRTGMTCRAEILVQQYDSAVYVPIQAVVRVGGEPTVYVVKEGKMASKTVALGPDNNRLIKIDAGLSAGEKVLLTPPIPSSSGDEQKTQFGQDELAAVAAASQNGPNNAGPEGTASPRGNSGAGRGGL